MHLVIVMGDGDVSGCNGIAMSGADVSGHHDLQLVLIISMDAILLC